MRSLSFLTLGILLVGSLGCNTSNFATPTAADVTPALNEFLDTEFGKHEDLQLTGPTDVSVGSYNEGIEGWPVYANFKASYTRDGVRNHYNGTSNKSVGGGLVKTGIPVCYVLKTEDRFFCFKSGMSKTLDDMQEKMRTVMSQSDFPKNGRMSRAEMNKIQRKMSAAMKGMKRPSENEIRSMMRDSMPRF